MISLLGGDLTKSQSQPTVHVMCAYKVTKYSLSHKSRMLKTDKRCTGMISAHESSVRASYSLRSHRKVMDFARVVAVRLNAKASTTHSVRGVHLPRGHAVCRTRIQKHTLKNWVNSY
jgi:hypothetical protein